jgi:hypothetical protein
MMVTMISAFVFAGVLSAYIFLGRSLTRQGFEMDLESHSRTALQFFSDDVHAASGIESGINPIYPAPTVSQFTVDVVLPVAPAYQPPVTVTGAATYKYSNGILTVVRKTPVAANTLMVPIWPTQDMGQTDVPRTLLTGVQSLSFTYYGANSLQQATVNAMKQIALTCTTVAPVGLSTPSAAQSHLTMTSGMVLMRNKGALQ